MKVQVEELLKNAPIAHADCETPKVNCVGCDWERAREQYWWEESEERRKQGIRAEIAGLEHRANALKKELS